MNVMITELPSVSGLKAKQQAAWASGDYALVGTTLQIVGEQLCETLDMRAGAKVLDVAAGNGNATLAAARRFCDVTSTDYVPALLEKGRARAEADRMRVEFRLADVEALPFEEGSFDYVISTFGVMFAPDHKAAAAEMLRVLAPQGRIGLANWTVNGFIGELFKVLGRHISPPAGVTPPVLWADPAHLSELFPGTIIDLHERVFNFRYRSAEHFVELFRLYYGPVHKAFLALDAVGQVALQRDLIELIGRFNTAQDGSMCAPSRYVDVVIRRA